jgi:hypothetical protein
MILPWEEIDRIPPGAPSMRVKRLRHIQYRAMWRVLFEGVEYYANDDELDLLWMGKTPTDLELELCDEEEHAA